MLTLLSNKFGKFISTGTIPVMNEFEVRRIRLLNIFFLIGTVAFSASTIQTFLVGGKEEGELILGLALLFEFGLIFLLLNKMKTAEFYLLSVSNLTLFIFENHHGPGAGTFLFYFPFMLII